MESINYEGYEIVKTRDGKYLIVDWYEYYDTLAEAKQEIRKFIGDVEATDFNDKDEIIKDDLKETMKNERQFIKGSKKVKEGYTLLGNEDKEILAFSNYNNAVKKAEELGLKLAEYGDVYGSNVSYAFWNKSGNRNDDEEVMCYYFFDKDGKPRADVTETELSQIAKAFGIPKSDIDDADEVIDDENLEEGKSKNDKWEIEWDYNNDVKDAPWFAIIVYNDKTNRNKFKADISLEDAKKLGLEDDGDEGFGDFTSFNDLEKIVGHKLKFERINEECKESVKRSNRKDKSSKKDKVIVFGKDTKLKEEARKIPYGVLAWQLNEIISGMNNEEAYYGSWLYIWPDGEDRQGAIEDFETKEDYQDLEDLFVKLYKAYHDDGLYNVSDKVLARAHQWDKKLGLEPIVDVKKERVSPRVDLDKELEEEE